MVTELELVEAGVRVELVDLVEGDVIVEEVLVSALVVG